MQDKNIVSNKIEELLTHGVHLSSNENNSEVISNYSPNNLKTIIISQEGAAFVFNTTSGSNNSTSTKVISFQQSEAYLDSWNNGKEALSVLIGSRVYSSVEEIIVFQSTGYEPLYTVPKRQITYIQNKVLPKLKRVHDVMLLNAISMSLQEFVSQYRTVLTDDFKHLSDIEDIQDGRDGTKIIVNKDWYKTTNMRPQYYLLDSKEGPLARVFNRRKEHFLAIEKEQEINEQVEKAGEKSSYSTDEIKQAKKQLDFSEELADYVTLAANINNAVINKLSKHQTSIIYKDNLNKTIAYQSSKQLNNELTKLLTTRSFSKFVSKHSISKEEYTVDNINELTEGMLKYITSQITKVYLNVPNQSETIVYKAQKQYVVNFFKKQSNNFDNITKYLAGKQIDTLTSNDKKTLKKLLTFDMFTDTQTQKEPLPIDENVTAKYKLQDMVKGLLTNTVTKEFVQDITDIFYLANGRDPRGMETTEVMYNTLLIANNKLETLEPADASLAELTNQKQFKATDTEQICRQIKKLYNIVKGNADELEPDFEKVTIQTEPIRQTKQSETLKESTQLNEEPQSESQSDIDTETKVQDEVKQTEIKDTFNKDNFDIKPDEQANNAIEDDLIATKEEQEAIEQDKTSKSQALKKFKFWVDKLEASLDTIPFDAGFKAIITVEVMKLISDYLDIYNDNTDISSDTITAINEATNHFVDNVFKYPEITSLVIFRKSYIKNLKSVNSIKTKQNQYPGVWATYFNTNGESLTLAEGYKYVKLIYTILKGRVR